MLYDHNPSTSFQDCAPLGAFVGAISMLLYVCVHYPSDILGGALLGIVIGWLFGRYFTKRFGNLDNKPVFIDASE
jgi:membrane-associated phospholipid phosphatase